MTREEREDAISRQAVLNTLDKMDKALDIDRTVENYKELLTECYKMLPSVTIMNDRKDCPYRQEENGNCLPVGGFCTSVADKYCKHLKEVENDN